MSNAVKCPMCNGCGKVYDAQEMNRTTSTSDSMKRCHGCNGAGWVIVP